MNSSQLDFTRKWFTEYVRQFETADGSLHPMHAIKVPHSLRVCINCRTIAADMDWPDDDITAAEAMGLLHDVGRFPQFKEYGTFADARSIDHGKLACDVIAASTLTAEYSHEDIRDILYGIRDHNKAKLASCTSPRGLAFLKLIRDADKLDIIKLMGDVIRSGDFTLYPELLLGVDPKGPPSPALIEEIARSRKGSYSNVHSLVDMHLIRLAWMFDLNYKPSLRLVLSRGLMEEIRDVIPDTPTIRKLVRETDDYISRQTASPALHLDPIATT